MVKEAQRLIADSGYRAALALGQGDTPEEVVTSTHLLDPVVMADMLGLLSVVDPSAIRKPLADAGIPSVEIAYGIANHAYSTVLDYDKMEQMAVKALRVHGHTEFAVVIYEYEETRGVFKIHRTVGEGQVISVPAKHVAPYAAYEAFKKWWASPGRPRAIFFEDDWLFECASRAILELGIKIPDDLAVITHSNVGRVFQFPVPVTCIEFDLAEVVSVAWSMLRTLVAGEEPESPVVYISPKLHEGSSL
jgi:DNA-binding LacI/PurR family transcriptional regulator